MQASSCSSDESLALTTSKAVVRLLCTFDRHRVRRTKYRTSRRCPFCAFFSLCALRQNLRMCRRLRKECVACARVGGATVWAPKEPWCEEICCVRRCSLLSACVLRLLARSCAADKMVRDVCGRACAIGACGSAPLATSAASAKLSEKCCAGSHKAGDSNFRRRSTECFWVEETV